MKHTRLVILTALVIAIGTAAAAGAIPGTDGAVVACYSLPDEQKGGGAGPLRPVDSASECTSDEGSVTLGARGPQGPAGPPGPAGPAGNNGQTVAAEAPQVFERVFDGILPGGRFSSLPLSGDPFEINVDVPAGSYVVLAQTSMYGLSSVSRNGRVQYYSGVHVTCRLTGAGQTNQVVQDFEFNEAWTQNLAITLDSPGRIALSCKIDKFDGGPDDEYFAGIRNLRLTATRLPQTRVTRTVTLVATLSGLPGTREQRLPTSDSITRYEERSDIRQISDIARQLQGR